MTGFITAIVATTAIVGSAVEQRNARKDQQRARKEQQKADKLTTQRSAIDQIRQAQITAASVKQAGENQGVGNSSAVAGSVGSITSQSSSNQAFAQEIFSIQQAKNRLMESAFDHMGNAANFTTVANVATTALGAKGKV